MIKLTGDLCRVGRTAARLSQFELARAANLAKQTVVDFEAGRRTPHPNNRAAIQRILEGRGIEFLMDGNGTVGVQWPSEVDLAEFERPAKAANPRQG